MTTLFKATNDELIAELHRRVGKGDVLAVKIWRADDINLAMQYTDDDRQFSDDEVARIAKYIGEVGELEECTEDDWSSLAYIVDEACKALGL